ncbi:MAG: O-antigen ligase family protein [Sulfuricurvum sp.]|uniref:O-antigen ligase family protein n=1 Tax=Sulfuricurvum sp. TaxID=2025608 RepID=UPI00356B01AB
MRVSVGEDFHNDRKKLKYSAIVSGLIMMWVLSIPMKNFLFQLGLGLIPLFFLYITMKNKELMAFIKEQPFSKGVLLFIVVISLANINAINFAHAWQFELRLLEVIFCMYALVYFIKNQYVSIRLIVISVLFSFGIQVIDGLIQYIYGKDIIGKTMLDGRMKAMVFHPNTFGLILALGIVVCLWLLLHRKEFKISLLVANLLTLLVALAAFDLLQTTSRGSWVATISTLVVYFWLERKNLYYRYYIYALIGGLGILFYIYSDPHLTLRIQSLLEGQSAGRDVIWPLALHYIMIKPLLGYGFDAFRLLPDVPSYGQMPHNIILEILLATGIIGLGTVTWLWYRLYCKILLYRHDEPRLYTLVLSSFVLLLIAGLFDHSIYQNVIYDSIWIILLSMVFRR